MSPALSANDKNKVFKCYRVVFGYSVATFSLFVSFSDKANIIFGKFGCVVLASLNGIGICTHTAQDVVRMKLVSSIVGNF